MKKFNSPQVSMIAFTCLSILVTLLSGCFFYLVFFYWSTGQTKLTVVYLLVLLFLVWNFASLLILTYSAVVYAKQFKNGDYDNAEKTIINTLALLKILPTKKLPLYLLYSNLGHMRLLQGKFAEAESPLRTAVSEVDAHKRLSKHYVPAIPVNNLARVCMRNHKLEEAKILAQRALAIYTANEKQSTWAPALSLVILGRIYFLEGQNQEAKEYFIKAEQAFASTNVPGYILADNAEHSKIACAAYLAILLFKEGNVSEARDKSNVLLDKIAKDSRYLTPDALAAINDLLQALNQNEEHTSAQSFLKYASKVAKRYPDHPDSKQILSN